MKRLVMPAIVLAFAAAAIHAQDSPKKSEMQCRDLTETYNLVGPDEIIVNGKVCKVVKMAASQVGAPQPPIRSKTSPVPEDSEIHNSRIVQMTKLGLGDDIIIARIKTGICKFALADSDLAELKKAGVSDKVIAVMLEASVLARPRVTIDGNPAELHTIGQEKVGGRLGHDVSLHIKSVKEKAYIQGQHASLFANAMPAIQIELPPDNTIDDYILVRMDGKGDRRELEMASGGGAVGHKAGIRSDRIEKMSYEPLGGRLYKVSVEKPLKHGEYILYIVGSADFEKGIFGRGYDFTVE
jgi:hypothetical protein